MATRRSSDDSDEEEEATAIDLRSSSQAQKKPIAGGAARRSSSSPSTPRAAPVAKASAVPHENTASDALHHKDGSSSGDEEATEFLSQRPSEAGIGALRARGRAVPLEAASAQARARSAKEEPTTTPEVQQPAGALPQRTPRPLPGRITNLKSETQTTTSSVGAKASGPRITRIFVDGGQRRDDDDPPSETDPGSDATDPPQVRPRPLPNANDEPRSDGPKPQPYKRAKTARNKAVSSETVDAEPADGTLIVEVPDGSVVFVDGVERGRGPSLKVRDLDRFAKHAVRIHAPGFMPWSGSVCLEGRTAAKIRPGLKKRP